MPTLVLQTVSPRLQLLILDERGLIMGLREWNSAKDEVRKMPPQLEEVLEGAGLNWGDVGRIVSVVGIGNFSATRIGVTMANIVAMAVEAVKGGTVELFELQLDKEITVQELAKLIAAKFDAGWQSVKLARPVYAAEPMISLSKKQKF